MYLEHDKYFYEWKITENNVKFLNPINIKIVSLIITNCKEVI